MRLLISFFNSFKRLFGMLAGPNAFLEFSELTINLTPSLCIALNAKVFSTGSER